MRILVYFVLLIRAVCDPLFDALKGGDAGGGMGAGAILNGLIIAIAAICLLRRPAVLARTVAPMWAIFLLCALVSVALAPDAVNAIRLCLVQVSYCAAFLIPFLLVRSATDLKSCLRVVLLSSLLPVLYGLVELALHGQSGADELRLKSTFSHANIFAFYLVLMISLILYLQKSSHVLIAPTMRWKLWLYAALMLALLILTKTRSAWAGCLLVFLSYGMLFQRRFVLYAILLPSLLLIDPSVRERLLDLSSNTDVAGGNLNSYAWRVLLWQAGLEWMQGSHALFGYGLDSFKFYSPRFFPLEGQDVWDPHNVYVQLIFETGIAGLFGYVWMFMRLLRYLRRGMRADRPGTVILMSIVLSYLLSSYFDNMLYYLAFNWYFWFFMGSVCAALALRRRQERKVNASAANALPASRTKARAPKGRPDALARENAP